jgi:hypothetical protein
MKKDTNNIKGKKFNMLTAIDYSHSNNGAFWNFKCDCGKTVCLRSSVVVHGYQKSCGCLAKSTMFKSKVNISKGDFINGLKILDNGIKEGHNKKYSFLCTCGNEFSALISNILKGNTTSCGCQKSKINREKNLKHGMSNSSIYRLWHNIMRRCYDPKNLAYKNYGGRGIKVCKRWHSFELFYKDMGEKPKGKSIERKNNNGNYSPSNCKWETKLIQANNTRKNIYITKDGITLTISQWAKKLNIPAGRIYARKKLGWSDDKLFNSDKRRDG